MKIRPYSVLMVVVLVASQYVYASPPLPAYLTSQLARVLAVVADTKNSIQQKKETSLLLSQYFDFRTFAQTTLQDYWLQLLWSERREFLTSFKEVFDRNIENRISANEIGTFSMRIVREEFRAGRKYVHCKVFYRGKSYNITLVWQNTQHGWRVIDVDMSGTSLSAGYQGQFNYIIRNNGFKDLIRRLKNNEIVVD